MKRNTEEIKTKKRITANLKTWKNSKVIISKKGRSLKDMIKESILRRFLLLVGSRITNPGKET
jgi:hypothetical protein